MTLYVITGPPCAGKSTWVRERAKPGDFVVDLDRIALAITSEDTPHHEYPPHIRRTAMALRSQLVTVAIRASRQMDAYVIHAKPPGKAKGLYVRSGAVFVDLTAPLDVLLARAATERPPFVSGLIRSWWTDDEQD